MSCTLSQIESKFIIHLEWERQPLVTILGETTDEEARLAADLYGREADLYRQLADDLSKCSLST